VDTVQVHTTDINHTSKKDMEVVTTVNVNNSHGLASVTHKAN